MQLNLLAAVAARFLADRIDFIKRYRKPLIIGGAALALVLAVLWLRDGKPSGPVRKQADLKPLKITDPNGDVWVLDLVKGQTVGQLADSDAKPGPPLTVKTDIQRNGPVLSIGLLVQGALGEQYVGGVMKNGQWQSPPAFAILDLNGRVLVRDSFKYG